MHVADSRPSPIVAGAEAFSSLPVVERDVHFVFALGGSALTSISLAQADNEIPWADADVGLGDALAGECHVDDVYRARE